MPPVLRRLEISKLIAAFLIFFGFRVRNSQKNQFRLVFFYNGIDLFDYGISYSRKPNSMASQIIDRKPLHFFLI